MVKRWSIFDQNFRSVQTGNFFLQKNRQIWYGFVRPIFFRAVQIVSQFGRRFDQIIGSVWRLKADMSWTIDSAKRLRIGRVWKSWKCKLSPLAESKVRRDYRRRRNVIVSVIDRRNLLTVVVRSRYFSQIVIIFTKNVGILPLKCRYLLWHVDIFMNNVD